ncbi:MAG: heparinase II/III family protein [Bacteroidetes bacterium]|jgi:hypothetical protein|nr:heparinase II/III family protein [Bacteroidota bacterium]
MRTPLLTLTAISILASSLVAQSKKQFPSDSVPRERPVTAAEMFAMLDTTLPALRPVHDALRSADTARAAQLFLDHLRRRSSPRYFFDPADASSRARRYAERYPDDAAFMKSKAESFQRTYGADVDWRVPGQDRRGRPHTPNTVRSLARHLYAENFAILYHVSGDRSTVRFQMDHLRDFLADYEAGKAETGGNDIFERFYAGHRIRNLMMFHQLMLASDALSVDEQMLMVRTWLLHGAKVIEGSRKFSWGNHQLVGLCALFEMTLMYPEFPVMREWNHHVYALILEHLEREVAADGFQFERASHYFKLDILNYFRVFRLAEVNGVEVPAWAENRYRRMFHAILAVLQPDGTMPPLQDAQDTYIGNQNLDEARSRLRASESPNTAELVDPEEGPFLGLGAYLFRDAQLKHFGSRDLHPAFTWFLEEDAPEVYRALQASPPGFTSAALLETGYYVMRGGWTPGSAYMIIDGGRAVEKPDHTHGGVLGLVAYADGSTILPNYRVQYSNPSYPFLKNSWVKNVALVDSLVQGRGWIPNAARTGFGKWAWLPTPTVTEWMSGPDVDMFAATHDGFDTIGVRYRRHVLFLKPYGWVVEDRLTGSAVARRAQQVWQGSYTTVRPGHLRAKHLDIYQALAKGLTVTEGGGFETVSAVFQTRPSKEHRFITALIPTEGGVPRPVVVSAQGGGGIKVVRSDTTDIVAFDGSGSMRSDGFAFDGEAVVLRTVKKQPTMAVLSHVRRIEWGTLRLQCGEPVSVELRRGDGGQWNGTVTGDRQVTLTFSRAGGRSTVVRTDPDQSFSVRW